MTKNVLLYSTLLFVFYSCSSNKEKEVAEEEKVTEMANDQPVEVKVKRLEYQDFNYELISNGTVAAKNKADLRFLSQDVIAKIFVKNGQRIAKGQKLAELDKFKLNNAMEQSKEAFERVKLDLQDVLISQGYSLSDSAKIPKEVMKIAKIRCNYEQTRTNYVMAAYNLNAVTLYAPFSGVVVNLSVKEFNQPGGDPFCTIIDNQNLEVVFNVLENELSFVNLNDKVTISPFSQSEHAVYGRVSEINPLIDKNGMVKVKAVVNQDSKLMEGMNVKVRVQRLLGKQLVIPKSALVLRTNKTVVFILKENRAKWVYVQTAQQNFDSYVITEGLAVGDSVIYSGNINLAHDTPVILKK